MKLPDIPKELINLWIHQLQEQEGLGYTVPGDKSTKYSHCLREVTSLFVSDTLKAELGARAEQERSFYAQ